MLKHNTLSNNLVVDADQINFDSCISIGNYLMIFALITMVSSILISFVFDGYFSLISQIVAHIGTIIAAGVIKVGYVIRCVGAHGLGYKAF